MCIVSSLYLTYIYNFSFASTQFCRRTSPWICLRQGRRERIRDSVVHTLANMALGAFHEKNGPDGGRGEQDHVEAIESNEPTHASLIVMLRLRFIYPSHGSTLRSIQSAQPLIHSGASRLRIVPKPSPPLDLGIFRPTPRGTPY